MRMWSGLLKVLLEDVPVLQLDYQKVQDLKISLHRCLVDWCVSFLVRSFIQTWESILNPNALFETLSEWLWIGALRRVLKEEVI
jgi:hypothetical protein